MASNPLPTNPPAEILWLVVDAVVIMIEAEVSDSSRDSWFGNRRRTLYTCSLVCKGMLQRANYHLYNTVILTDSRLAPCFARTMAECDHLALMVEHFGLYISDFLSQKGKRFDTPFPPSVVARLSNLKSLEFNGGYLSESARFTVMPPAAVNFAKLFAPSCPSLQDLSFTQLRFTSYTDLVSLVWSFPHIRQVTTSYVARPDYDYNMSETDHLGLLTAISPESRQFSLTSLIVWIRSFLCLVVI